MVMLEKKPSGGYRTKGNDSDGVIIRVVPGGKANLPSEVIQRNRFCLEWCSSEDPHKTPRFNMTINITTAKLCIVFMVVLSLKIKVRLLSKSCANKKIKANHHLHFK